MYRSYEEYMRNVLNYKPVHPVNPITVPNVLYPNTYMPGYNNVTMGDIMNTYPQTPSIPPISTNNNQIMRRPPHIQKNIHSNTAPSNNFLKF